MEFAFDVRVVLPDAVTRIAVAQLPLLGNSRKRDERGQQLAAIVNKLGAASAKAQGLRVAVTTYQKLTAASHTLYLLREDGDLPAVMGLLKVGRKKLFLTDPQGMQREVEPLCVLDFYVHESKQRAGHGRRLFQTMLNMEGVRVSELAIDKPSGKFLSFLRKHYKLHSDIKQGNNFVIFSQFFQNANLYPRPIPKRRQLVEQTEDDHHHHPQDRSSPARAPSQSIHPHPASVEAHTSLTVPGNSSSSTDNRHTVLTTPKHHRRIFPVSTGNNFNWSPETVLHRQQHILSTPCDIITGAPLLTSHWKIPQTQQWSKGDSRKAPLLTMREKHRHHFKGGSRLGFGVSPHQQLSLATCHLAGLGVRGDSAYSRHSLNPIRPSSHAPIQPDLKPLNISLDKPNCE